MTHGAPRPLRRSTVAFACVALVVLVTGVAFGQEFRSRLGSYGFASPEEAVERSFLFCRVAYRSVRREANGRGWLTDYPRADANLTLRLSQLTKTRVPLTADGEPFHAVVELLNDGIYRCPFLFMSDVGTAGFSEEEAARLQDYLRKGGFLYVDDFWGDAAWEQWSANVARVLPGLPIVDVPLGHELRHALYDVSEIPQLSNLRFWRGTGGVTSERGAESAEPHFRAVFDEHGRALIAMTHNTDIADGWERESDDVQFFSLFSPDAYGLAINVVLYSLSH